MEVKRLNCASCGAPISVPDDLDYINCASCGSFLAVQRGEGYVALKIAEKISQSIEDSGKETQAAIRQTAQDTQNELRRLQLQYDLSTAELKLSGIQAEIRSIAPNNVLKIREMRYLEYLALERVRGIKRNIANLGNVSSAEAVTNLTEQITLLSYSIFSLSQANQRSDQVRDGLKKLRNEDAILRNQLFNLKVKMITRDLITFQDQGLSDANQVEIYKSLGNLGKDLEKVRYLPKTNERQVVEKDILKKYSDYYQRWSTLEVQRIKEMLVSNTEVDLKNMDLAASQTILADIQKDIQLVSDMHGNAIAASILSELRNKERDVQRHIHRLERTASRISAAQTYADSGSKPGLAGVGVVVGAFITDLFYSQPNLGQTTPSTEKASIESKRANQDKTLSASQPPSPPVMYSEKHRKFNGLVLRSLLISGLVGFSVSCLGLVVSSLILSPSSAADTPPYINALLISPITIGFIFGSLLFLRLITPWAGYSFLGGKKLATLGDIRVSPATVKVFSALIILVGGLLLSLNLGMAFETSTGISLAVICLAPIIFIGLAITMFFLIKEPKLS